jgi:hypothetical protein
MDSLKNVLVGGDGGGGIPYLRENGDGVGEGGRERRNGHLIV